MSMSAIETLNVSMKSINARMAALREELFKETEDAFNGVFKEFFDAFPEVRTIHWTQYTPYFMDGEPCVFSVGEAYFSPKEHTDLEGTYGDDGEEGLETSYWNSTTREYVRNPEVSDALVAAMGEMANLISGMEDYLKDRFGDHQYIKVHRGGVEAEEYSHD